MFQKTAEPSIFRVIGSPLLKPLNREDEEAAILPNAGKHFPV
jgi:hypothetical protein